MWTEIHEHLDALWSQPYLRAAIVIAGAIAAAYLVEILVARFLAALAARSRTDLDDKLIAALRRPIFITVIIAGLAWALSMLVAPGTPRFIAYGTLRTLAIVVWTAAAMQIGSDVLGALSHHGRGSAMVQPRTLPLFDILLKVFVISGAVYFAFLSWNIDVTAWLASAGIIGVAVGFAAKDSLAHVVAGIFILADSPYKVGDWIVLDSGLRGLVTRVGMRSTRILTIEDVEIAVPNSVMGNASIINEAGGPREAQRIKATVTVACTSDVDRVAKVLLSCAEDLEGRCDQPEPQYRFHAFGGSGLEFELLVWIAEPALRDRVISDLNMRIFKRFAEEGIEIAYNRHQIYVKEMPGTAPGTGHRASARAV